MLRCTVMVSLDPDRQSHSGRTYLSRDEQIDLALEYVALCAHYLRDPAFCHSYNEDALLSLLAASERGGNLGRMLFLLVSLRIGIRHRLPPGLSVRNMHAILVPSFLYASRSKLDVIGHRKTESGAGGLTHYRVGEIKEISPDIMNIFYNGSRRLEVFEIPPIRIEQFMEAGKPERQTSLLEFDLLIPAPLYLQFLWTQHIEHEILEESPETIRIRCRYREPGVLFGLILANPGCKLVGPPEQVAAFRAHLARAAEDHSA